MMNLLVLKVQNVEVSLKFYQELGLEFVKEQHDNGPIHYSCDLNGTIFEIYPANDDKVTNNLRLGFNVEAEIFKQFLNDGNKLYEYFILLKDPDLNYVHISTSDKTILFNKP